MNDANCHKSKTFHYNQKGVRNLSSSWPQDQRGMQNMFSTPSAQTEAKSPDHRSSHQLEGALKEVHTSAEDAAPVAQRLPGRSKALGSIPRAKI